jgi:hypothetical protein
MRGGQVKWGRSQLSGLHGVGGTEEAARRGGAARAPSRVGEGRGKGSPASGLAWQASHSTGWAKGHWANQAGTEEKFFLK